MAIMYIHCISDRGHSTTTWTKFYPILTPHLPREDTYNYVLDAILLVHVTKHGLSTDPIPPLYMST